MTAMNSEQSLSMKSINTVNQFSSQTHNYGSCQCEEIIYDQSHCREYVVKQPKPSAVVFIFSVILLNILGYHGEVYAQDHTLLSGFILVLFLLLLINMNLRVDQESLLVMSSVGVQYTKQYISGRTVAEFIEKSQVKDIIINEAVCLQRVIYYLAILLRDNNTQQSMIKPIFLDSLLRLNGLKRIYSGVHEVLDFPPKMASC